jgi:hypothetical protein
MVSGLNGTSPTKSLLSPSELLDNSGGLESTHYLRPQSSQSAGLIDIRSIPAHNACLLFFFWPRFISFSAAVVLEETSPDCVSFFTLFIFAYFTAFVFGSKKISVLFKRERRLHPRGTHNTATQWERKIPYLSFFFGAALV